MNIIETATVSGLLIIVALAVLASTVMLGIVVRDYLADRPPDQATRPDAAPRSNTAIRRIAAIAALVLGIQVTAACGTENATPDTVDAGAGAGAGAVLVLRVGSADAVERRAATLSGNPVGSADAVERRLTVERSGACSISADAAEQNAACVERSTTTTQLRRSNFGVTSRRTVTHPTAHPGLARWAVLV